MDIRSIFSSLGDSLRSYKEAKENGSHTPLEVRIAAIVFASKRADYYRFVADVIEGTKGRKSLRDIFRSDALRYENTARGKLSEHWARQFEEGGSLAKAFAGTLPRQDVAILDTLQRATGEGGLEQGLRDLADNTALVAKARSIMFTTMAASLVCIALVLGLVFTMPSYTVPKLAEAFSMLPQEMYPASARHLFNFADFVSENWLYCMVGVTFLLTLCLWSISFATGPTRKFLDKYGFIWGLYRDFQSVRLLCNLASMLRKRGNSTHGLREAVEMQLHGASRWKTYHINKMLSMIDRGEIGPSLFSTGILDRETTYYIADLISSRGLEDALQFVRERLEKKVLARISVQAALFSWALMIGSIGIAAYLMFLHVEAIDDMRSALQQYLA